jgi:hypothetical protein
MNNNFNNSEMKDVRNNARTIQMQVTIPATARCLQHLYKCQHGLIVVILVHEINDKQSMNSKQQRTPLSRHKNIFHFLFAKGSLVFAQNVPVARRQILLL